MLYEVITGFLGQVVGVGPGAGELPAHPPDEVDLIAPIAMDEGLRNNFV